MTPSSPQRPQMFYISRMVFKYFDVLISYIQSLISECFFVVEWISLHTEKSVVFREWSRGSESDDSPDLNVSSGLEHGGISYIDISKCKYASVGLRFSFEEDTHH